jgi:hypothetical protein
VKKKGRDISGLETLRALAGTVGMGSFTVAALSENTGVPRATVDTVLRRYKEEFFEPVGTVAASGRGRPAVLWRVRAAAIDDVVAEVERIQPGIRAVLHEPADAEDAELSDASLALAADSILRADTDDPDAALAWVDAGRTSLLAAGFDPGFLADDVGVVTAGDVRYQHARLISAVADVVEAGADRDWARIDEAQANAFRLLEQTKSDLPAEQWLPLARRVVEAGGTVLAAGIALVHPGDREVFENLFPTLTSVPSDNRADTGAAETLVDARLGPSAAAGVAALPPVLALLLGNPAIGGVVTGVVSSLVETAIRGFEARRSQSASRVMVTSYVDTDLWGAVADHDVHLVLSTSQRETQECFARTVNRVAVGLDT